MTEWSDIELNALREGIEAGLSARLIADRIGRTRNAIIGKATRLSLTFSNTTTTLNPNNTGLAPQGRSKARRARLPGGTVSPLKKTKITHRGPDNVVPWGAELPPDLWTHAQKPVRLLELSRHTCRWPLDHGLYCGAEPVKDKSYCAAHYRVAYQKHRNEFIAPNYTFLR